MFEYRCKRDNKLLMKACMIDADVQIKCRACGMVNRFEARSEDLKYMCGVYPCPNRVPVTKKITS